MSERALDVYRRRLAEFDRRAAAGEDVAAERRQAHAEAVARHAAECWDAAEARQADGDEGERS